MSNIRFIINFCSILLFTLYIPVVALANSESYTPLVGIPGIQNTNDFGSYINALYALSISVAALIAVVKIVIAGAKYMLDDIVTHKTEAKAEIKSSIIGLLIIIGAVVILTTINSDLTDMKITATSVSVDGTQVDFGSDIITSIDNLEKYGETIHSPITYEVCDKMVYQGVALIDSEYADSCKEKCNSVYNGIFYDGWALPFGVGEIIYGVIDSRRNYCYYIPAEAARCDDQKDPICCVNIKNGTWDSTLHTCTITAAQTQELVDACYSPQGNTWVSDPGTCLTTKCDTNTDKNCCEIYAKSTWNNNTCIFSDTGGVISAQDCLDKDQYWNQDIKQCVSPQSNTDYVELTPGEYAECSGSQSDTQYQSCMDQVCSMFDGSQKAGWHYDKGLDMCTGPSQ